MGVPRCSPAGEPQGFPPVPCLLGLPSAGEAVKDILRSWQFRDVSRSTNSSLARGLGQYHPTCERSDSSYWFRSAISRRGTRQPRHVEARTNRGCPPGEPKNGWEVLSGDGLDKSLRFPEGRSLGNPRRHSPTGSGSPERGQLCIFKTCPGL